MPSKIQVFCICDIIFQAFLPQKLHQIISLSVNAKLI